MTTDQDLTIVDVTGLIADEGSVVYFTANDLETGDKLVFVADHRPAEPLAQALYETDEIVTVAIDTWQIVSRRSPTAK